MKRDVQKSRVYQWEDTLSLDAIGLKNSTRRCSMKKCRELINLSCDLYNLPHIHVVKPRNPKQAYAAFYGGVNEIVLPDMWLRKDVALHEVAHYISNTYWPDDSPHGKIFVRVYMHLLQHVLGADLEFLERWAYIHNVEFTKRKNYAPKSSI